MIVGPPLSIEFEKALRLASVAHHGQVRKGSGVPYIEHPMAVAMILDRAGFDESTVIAGLLHDVVEDTDVTLDRVREAFGGRVAGIVADCSEEKLDAQGSKRPWSDRKRDHIAAIAAAGDASKAVALADKFHNLLSIRLDLAERRPAWDSFHADREGVIRYHEVMIAACSSRDGRVSDLARECRALLAEVEALGGEISKNDPPEG